MRPTNFKEVFPTADAGPEDADGVLSRKGAPILHLQFQRPPRGQCFAKSSRDAHRVGFAEKRQGQVPVSGGRPLHVDLRFGDRDGPLKRAFDRIGDFDGDEKPSHARKIPLGNVTPE